MRRLVTLAVLGMLGTALLVSGSHAQANPSLGIDGSKDLNGQVTKIGWVNSADSVVNKVTNLKPLPITDASRDRDYSCTYNNIISDTTATYMSDSSAVLPTGDCKRWFLNIRVTGFTGGAAAIPYTKLAIRIRKHTGGASDSLNTNIWDPSPRITSSADSDSLTFGSVVAPTTATLTSTDIQVILVSEAGSVAKWAGPHNYTIPLHDTTGNWYEGAWTSVAYRVLAASNTPLTYTVSLEGKP